MSAAPAPATWGPRQALLALAAGRTLALTAAELAGAVDALAGAARTTRARARACFAGAAPAAPSLRDLRKKVDAAGLAGQARRDLVLNAARGKAADLVDEPGFPLLVRDVAALAGCDIAAAAIALSEKA